MSGYDYLIEDKPFNDAFGYDASLGKSRAVFIRDIGCCCKTRTLLVGNRH